MARALSVAQVIAGEAVSGTQEERMADMRAIASVIANRAALLGVTPEQVVANSNEFNAYNKSLPPGVGEDIVAMAQEQIDYVAENGPVNNATFYATPSAADNLPGGLSYETATTGHQFFSDPQMRSIGTSEGYVQPNQYAFAQNMDVASVPTPYAPDDLTNSSLMAAFSATPTYSDDPFSAVLGGQQPAVNQWGDMAAADPVKSPMSSVQATGFLGPGPELSAQARANPMMSIEAQGFLGGVPGLEAGATVSGLPQVASVSDRMGIAEPGFDQSRFDSVAPSVTEMDASRFSTPAKTSRIGTSLPGLTDTARMNPLTGAIDPATNTQSFMDQPADLGNMPAAYAAQRGVPTGLLSADMQSVQGNVERQLQNPSSLAPMVAPQTAMMNVPATGLLGAVPGLEAQATVPSLQSAYTQAPAVAPAGQAIDQNVTGSVTPGLLSPTSIAAANVPISSAAMVPNSIIPSQPVQQNAFVDSFPSAVANNTIEPATVNDVVAAPTLDTMQVAEQPTVATPTATIEGPATTPAVEQAERSVQTPANTVARTQPQAVEQSSFASRIKNALNPGTAVGGLIGAGLLGVPGALAGGFLGNGIYNGGFLDQPSMEVNNIGSGSDAVYSVWGGAQDPGTQATASDGQQITSLSGGRVAVTGKTGAVTVFDSTGKAMGYFGSDLSGGTDQDTEGRTTSDGLFGGLFG